PSARFDAALAFDFSTRRTVLFGGFSSPNVLGDTWEYDGTTWNQVQSQAQPSPRSLANMVSDLVRGRLVLFGGLSSQVAFNDTWEYYGGAWHQVVTSLSPNFFWGPSVYDLARGLTVHCQFANGLSSPWSYDGRTWTPGTPTAVPASFGSGPSAAAYDAV